MAPPNVDLGHAIGLPPAEAIDYFAAKGFRVTHDWREMAGDAHAQAFTVSKMARFDLLASTRQAIDAKLRAGSTQRELAGELEALFRTNGWWGRQVVSDGAGGEEVVQLGSPWRIRTIIRTNVATAYNAGRYRRQSEIAAARPYWQYLAIRDASSRPSHAAMHGKVFRADDPIWDTIYPANGFGCRCRVRALSERQVRRRGLHVIDNASAEAVEQRVGLDRRTGELMTRTGQRITWRDDQGRPQEFTPDPGWSHNPGKEALPPLEPSNARAASGQPTWRDYDRPDARRLPAAPAPSALPETGSVSEAIARANSHLGLTGPTNWRKVKTPVDDVIVRRGLTPHMVSEGDARGERHANRIVPTLEAPDEVWMTWYDDGQFRNRYLKAWDDGALSMVTERKDGSLLWDVILDGADVNRPREGVLLYPRQK